MKNLNKQEKKANSLGAYRWLIVFGSFIIYFLADGISLSFGLIISQVFYCSKKFIILFEILGIFTREFIEYFHQDESQSLAFITSGLLQSVPLFLSPIVCIIINKYECRPVAFIGSVILFFSLIFTRFFVNNLISLNIIVGLMTSCGLACVYIPG